MGADVLGESSFAIVQALPTRAATWVHVSDINLPGRFGGLGLACAVWRIPGIPVIVRK